MSATMLGASEIAMTELGKSIPDRVIVESNRGKIIAIGAGPGALLIVMAEADASIELMFVELKKAAEKIKEVLGLTRSGSPA
jgi:predicted regulator of Ras-like GTPase activity (Roadblock/LC7/MglB family)